MRDIKDNRAEQGISGHEEGKKGGLRKEGRKERRTLYGKDKERGGRELKKR